MLSLYPKLEEKIRRVLNQKISEQRKFVLKTLIEYIQIKLLENKEVYLNFICTHNSRRSQFSQIWAHTAAAYYEIKTHCYSGGIEVTAFNPRAIAAIKRSGFKVRSTNADNPHYRVSYNDQDQPVTVFSKLFDHPINHAPSFAAIMTCSHADINCPFIPGAEKRITIRYEDPKAFDDSPQETEKYDKCELQIASELFYIFKKVSQKKRITALLFF